MVPQLSRNFRVALVMTVTMALSAGAWAQQPIVVIGTGNPEVDVPAIQAAVKLGGEVVLRGRFSFDTRPTIPTALQAVGIQLATILVSKAVAISGAPDASIEAGTIPFYVAAPGATVSIQKVRFVRPRKSAILVYAASGLVTLRAASTGSCRCQISRFRESG